MRTRLPRPYAANAGFSRWLAVFSLTLMVATILWRRAGVLDLDALAYLGLGVLGAAFVAVLLALVAAAQILKNSARGFRDAVAGFSVGGLVLVIAGIAALAAALLPRVNLVTTEPALVARETGWLRPLEEVNAGGGDLDLYSDILPLRLDVSPEQAFAAADTVLRERGWRLAERVTPLDANGRPARLRAVVQTPVLGFLDDVLVVITPEDVDPGGPDGGENPIETADLAELESAAPPIIERAPQASRIDVMSASRLGAHDFGANARRVTALLRDVRDEAR